MLPLDVAPADDLQSPLPSRLTIASWFIFNACAERDYSTVFSQVYHFACLLRSKLRCSSRCRQPSSMRASDKEQPTAYLPFSNIFPPPVKALL
jgi:hypothetical protein